jgi:hypothetical protein
VDVGDSCKQVLFPTYLALASNQWTFSSNLIGLTTDDTQGWNPEALPHAYIWRYPGIRAACGHIPQRAISATATIFKLASNFVLPEKCYGKMRPHPSISGEKFWELSRAAARWCSEHEYANIQRKQLSRNGNLGARIIAKCG